VTAPAISRAVSPPTIGTRPASTGAGLDLNPSRPLIPPETLRSPLKGETALSVEEIGESRRAGGVATAPTPFEIAAARAYAEGRREQRCICGRSEAGGAYCTGCLRPSRPDDWTAVELSDARRAAIASARSRRTA
jgi:hypothetical protein